jgi:flagellar hook-basal body complex protein FliE
MSGVTIKSGEMTRLLAEMQRLAATADARPTETTGETRGFADLLRSSIAAVNEAQSSSYEMAAALERGDRSVSLPEVMIALQKASLSFQAMTEVRNRLVNAYQEIMNMPI